MAPGFGRKNCPSPADGVCSRLCPAGTKLPVAVAPREKGMEDPPPRAAEVQQPLSTSCPVQTPFARAVLATEACWPPRMVSVTFAVTKGPASPDAVSSMDEHVNPATGATAAAVTGAVMANPRPSWAGVIQMEPLLARTTPHPHGSSSLLAADGSWWGFGPKVSYAVFLLLKRHSPVRLRSGGGRRAFADVSGRAVSGGGADPALPAPAAPTAPTSGALQETANGAAARRPPLLRSAGPPQRMRFLSLLESRGRNSSAASRG